ncbi:Clr6 histone deacetylase associated PHD protein-2 Cph2, partial [Elasticomyces elasticus]
MSGITRTRQALRASQSGAPTFLNVPREQVRHFGHQQQYMYLQKQPTYTPQPRAPGEAQNIL